MGKCRSVWSKSFPVKGRRYKTSLDLPQTSQNPGIHRHSETVGDAASGSAWCSHQLWTLEFHLFRTVHLKIFFPWNEHMHMSPDFPALERKEARGVQNYLGILLWQRHRKICMLSTPNVIWMHIALCYLLHFWQTLELPQCLHFLLKPEIKLP